jgi:hypothetical protein
MGCGFVDPHHFAISGSIDDKNRRKPPNISFFRHDVSAGRLAGGNLTRGIRRRHPPGKYRAPMP